MDKHLYQTLLLGAWGSLGILVGYGVFTLGFTTWQDAQTLMSKDMILLKGVVRGLPLLLFLVSLGLLLEVVTQESMFGKMKPRARALLFWMPRVVAILLVLFPTFFALNILNEDIAGGHMLLSVQVPLSPRLFLGAGVLLAWRWEWVGAVVFMGWALWYAMTTAGFVTAGCVSLGGVPFIVGLLFLLGWMYRAEFQPASRGLEGI
jgi:hypothetical protein